MKARELLESNANWKREAFEFQQLVISNPYIDDIDVTIKKDNDSQTINIALEHEFFDLTFILGDKDHFVLIHESDIEEYGKTAQEAYRNAFPVLIGLKAGYALKNNAGLDIDDFMLGVEQDQAVLTLYRDRISHYYQQENDIVFVWIAEKQGFMLKDSSASKTVHKTIASMIDGCSKP